MCCVYNADLLGDERHINNIAFVVVSVVNNHKVFGRQLVNVIVIMVEHSNGHAVGILF